MSAPACSPALPPLLVERAVRAALEEDLGRAGDITSQATIPAVATARAAFVARQPGVLAGLDCARTAFALLDASVRFEPGLADGAALAAGTVIATVEGTARAVLAGERVALNYLCHLSGVASAAHAFAARVAHTEARICCTRKTTPGLRALEKYAVRCGGGANHRFGLDDAILIKENHIAVAGGTALAIGRARAAAGHLVSIEVEVETLAQLEEALGAGPDAVLLDNMSVEDMRKAVKLTAGRAALEASGGITLETVADIAATGVDYISSGWITHSAPALDIGLDISLD